MGLILGFYVRWPGADPGICEGGSPSDFFPLYLSLSVLSPPPLEVGPLKPAIGSEGALYTCISFDPSWVRGEASAENEFGAL